MNLALILACGNPLGGDDGIAVGLARYFRAEFCEPETDIRSSQQWTRELAEPISQSDIVLFVDASVNLPPGKIQRTPECAYLLTIGGKSFDHPDHLLEPVRSAIPVALDLIKAARSGVSVHENPFRSQNAPA